MKKLILPITILAGLSLESCVQWDIGGRIRNAGVSYKGVDLGTDKEQAADGQSATEVSYRLKRPYVTSAGFIAGTLYVPQAVEVQPTGRQTTVPPLVSNKEAEQVQSTDGHCIRQTEKVKGPGYYWYATAAAPFDYLFDPLLDVLCSPFFVLFE